MRTTDAVVSNLDPDAGDQHLLFSFSLPESAANEFQGLTSTIRSTFTVANPPPPGRERLRSHTR